MEPTAVQLGGAFALAMALIELIKYIITRYTTVGSGKDDISKACFDKMTSQLELMNTNHLSHIEGAINTGNDKIVNAITNMHLDMIKELKK